MQLSNISEKLGPLELWQWGVIGVGAGFTLISLFGKKKASVPKVAAAPATPSPDTSGDIFGLGGDTGGGSAGGGYGTYTQSSTFQCPDGSIVTDPRLCTSHIPVDQPVPPGGGNGGGGLLAYWQARYDEAYNYCLSNAQRTGQTGKETVCASWALGQVGPKP